MKKYLYKDGGLETYKYSIRKYSLYKENYEKADEILINYIRKFIAISEIELKGILVSYFSYKNREDKVQVIEEVQNIRDIMGIFSEEKLLSVDFKFIYKDREFDLVMDFVSDKVIISTEVPDYAITTDRQVEKELMNQVIDLLEGEGI